MVEQSKIAAGSGRPSPRRPSVTSAAATVALMAALLASVTAVVSAQPSPSAVAPATESAATAPATTGPASSPAPASAATLWEYRTLFVTWDSAAGNWVADFSDGTRIVGLDEILNGEGANGWELVAVVPELWTQVVDDAIREDARRLRMFLKKPLG